MKSLMTMWNKNLVGASLITLTILTGCNSTDVISSSSSETLNIEEMAEPEISETSFDFPQTSCGDEISADTDVWWRVYVDDGNLEGIRNQYCKDAFATTREDIGVKTVQVASFRQRERAEAFAEEVEGSIKQVKRTVNTSQDSNLVRFEYTRWFVEGQDVGLAPSSDSHPPFSTDCNSSEIKEYISKSISGGSEASPFAEEFRALLACGSEAVPFLLESLSTDDEYTRFNATIALGEMGAVANEKVVPVLIDTIENDANALIRTKAIEAIRLISPPNDQVISVLLEAQTNSDIVPGSNLNPRGELLPVSEFANDTLLSMGKIELVADDYRFKQSTPPPRTIEYRDARCPVKYAYSSAVNADYRTFYSFDENSGKCIAEGNDRPPATGGDFIIKAFCDLFNCKKN